MQKPLVAIALGGGITLAALGFVGIFLWMESPAEDEQVEGVVTLADGVDADQPTPHPVDASDYEPRDKGVQIYDIEVGTGAQPVEGQTVEVHYSGWLADGGKMFDSSVHNDRPPIDFQLGRPGIIEGWQIGLADMKVGGKRQIVIPPEVAYGERGRPPVIPGNATLVFDVELVDVGEIRNRPDQPEIDFATAAATTLDSGVQYVDIEEGSGNEAVERSPMNVEMTLWTQGGDVFFSTKDRKSGVDTLVGGQRAERLPLDGLDAGVRGMKQGGVRYMKLPADQAFGERGQPPAVGPNEDLYALVEALEISAPRVVPESIVDFDRGAMTTTESGLMYLDVVEGDGVQPEEGDIVFAEYSGWLENGTLFDSSYKRRSSFDFPLGKGRVIKAWDEAIASMKVGGKRIIVAPPDIAYGERSRPSIPANSTLVFEIELVDVKKPE